MGGVAAARRWMRPGTAARQRQGTLPNTTNSHASSQCIRPVDPDLVAGLDSTQAIDGFQPKHDGRNVGGPYHTDGKLSIGVLKGGR
jgi:hypothetical protein